MIKAIIFDYDGVIVDSFACLYDIYKIIFKELKRDSPSTIEEFRKDYGYSYTLYFKKLGLTEEERRIASKIYLEKVVEYRPALFEGIEEVLRILHNNFKLGVLSANYLDEVNNKLDLYNLKEYFDFVIANEKIAIEILPKAEELKKLMLEHNLKADEILYIGDRTIDYDEATKVGIKTIIVEYGWGYDKEKVPEQAIKVNKAKELLKAIKYASEN